MKSTYMDKNRPQFWGDLTSERRSPRIGGWGAIRETHFLSSPDVKGAAHLI